MAATLFYVHDPMCSWCWAFGPTLSRLVQRLPAEVAMVKLLGGLAPDTDEPMPEAMRERLQQTWQMIEQTVPGTRFNYAFWHNNTPRRATYPACRAVLAARAQQSDEAMLEAIQKAYYQEARNPSDSAILEQLAGEIGLDRAAFCEALNSPRIQQQLEKEMAQAEALGVDSYPSLVLQVGNHHWPVPVDYLNEEAMLANIEWMLEEA
jgi:putative protein-disulfide isomerase